MLTKNNLGLLFREQGEREQARLVLSEAIESLTTASVENNDDILVARGLAAALANLSSLSLDSDPSKSVDLLEQAIDHQLRISRDSPSRLKASSEIATTYNSLGAAYLRSQQPRSAADAFSSAVQIQRRLHAIAPLVDSHRVELAMSLSNLATALHQQENDREAIAAAKEAISLQLACLQRETIAASSLSRLAVMYNNLGRSLEAIGEKEQAEESFYSAIEHQRSAVSVDQESRPFLQNLLQHYSNLLRLQIRGQQWRDAEMTAKDYRNAASRQPVQLLAVAEDIAKLSQLAPAGVRQDRVVSDSAATLVAAREAGMKLDASLLLREPFRAIAHVPSLRKAMQP